MKDIALECPGTVASCGRIISRTNTAVPFAETPNRIIMNHPAPHGLNDVITESRLRAEAGDRGEVVKATVPRIETVRMEANRPATRTTERREEPWYDG